MKQVEASYKIDDMPGGEEALAKLERLGRIAYKSEDRIDDGREICTLCEGRRFNYVEEADSHVVERWCEACARTGQRRVREPSSHKFVRMILQAERKAKMILMGAETLEKFDCDWEYFNDGSAYSVENRRELATQLVSNVIGYMRENPAHESVIEHCSATVVFTSNRGFTHELVRHRLASFTQESTRYCDYNKGKFDGEISVIERTDWGKLSEMTSMTVSQFECLTEAGKVWREAMEHVEAAYKRLRAMGIPPEIARDVLPQALKADIAVTANFRQWRLMFALRDSPRAHPDMRRLMGPLHEDFKLRIPIVFD